MTTGFSANLGSQAEVPRGGIHVAPQVPVSHGGAASALGAGVVNTSVPAPARLVIATRVSRLALWQAYHVRDLLQLQYPACQIELLEMTTQGDRILDRSLSKIGGKGLFVKELENALLDGRADLAVHSLKDVPVALPEAFRLAAILPRADARDAFVSPHYRSLENMPEGAVLGTSSLRRAAQVLAAFPHLDVRPLRGNLDTRLAKLDRGEYDAIILAAVGLQRLGLADRIRDVLSPEISLPAVGQGALGIEVLAGRTEVAGWMAPLNCEQSWRLAQAERTVSAVLGGSCQVPLGAYAQARGDAIRLRALVASPDGKHMCSADVSGPADAPEALGHLAAERLVAAGARELLAMALSSQNHGT